MEKIVVISIVLLILVGALFFYKKNQSQKSGSMNQINQVQVAVSQVPNPGQSTASGVALPQEVQLIVNAPTDGQTVTTSNITVSGKTVPNAEVSLNEKDLRADAAGNFSTSVTLDEGENVISISTYDQDGNYADKDITVTLQTENVAQ